MPKKTRKQKMQADSRHKKDLALSVENIIAAPVKSSSMFQFQVEKSRIVQGNRTESDIELRVIRFDIAKTVVLAVIAVAIEFALYFRWYR